MGCNCRKPRKPAGMGVTPPVTPSPAPQTQQPRVEKAQPTAGQAQAAQASPSPSTLTSSGRFGSKLEQDAARVRMTFRR